MRRSASPGVRPALEQAIEFESGIPRNASERRCAETDSVVVRERQLPPLGVAIHAMRAAPTNELEPGPFERT
jgi:hypothetical protein